MAFYGMIKTTKTSETGQIGSDGSILPINGPKNRGKRVLRVRRGRSGGRRRRKRRGVRGSWEPGWSGSMRSTCSVQLVRRKRRGKGGRGAMRSAVPPHFTPPRAKDLKDCWDTTTYLGPLLAARWRKWWALCCTVLIDLIWLLFGKCSVASRPSGTRTSFSSAVEAVFWSLIGRGSSTPSLASHRSSTDSHKTSDDVDISNLSTSLNSFQSVWFQVGM